MNLFIIKFKFSGQVASYYRTVQVIAENEREAIDRVFNHFNTVSDVRVVKVAAKFSDFIFGTSIIAEKEYAD